MLFGGNKYKSNTFTADTKKVNSLVLKQISISPAKSEKFSLNLITFASERQI